MRSDESPGGIRELVQGLLDFDFETVVTTRLLPIVYRVAVVAIALGLGWQIVQAFGVSWLRGLLWLCVLGPAAFLALVTAVRVVLELVISIFRIAVHVEYLSRRMVDVAEQTEEIAADLPRIKFWKWRDRRVERQPPPPPGAPGES